MFAYILILTFTICSLYKITNETIKFGKFKGNSDVDLSKSVVDQNYHRFNELINWTDVNEQDTNGNTALMFAAFKNYTYFATQLVNAGADPKIENDDGINSIDAARYSFNMNLVRIFI